MQSTARQNPDDAAAPKSRSKGELTRERIKLGFIRALDSKNHLKITIDDICQNADITVGGFYFHFKNQQILLDEVVSDYITALVTRLDAAIDDDDLDESVQGIIDAFLSAYSEQEGLTRCFQQLVRTQTDFARVWQQQSAPCTQRLARSIRRVRDGLSEQKSTFLAISVVTVATTALNVDYFMRARESGTAAGSRAGIAATVTAMCRRMITGGSNISV